jgi:YHS domain-containing protein
MLVKCKICGNKIDRTIAYKVIINEKNNYYCSEDEYTNYKKAQDIKNNTYSLIYKIFGRTITNTILFKEISELSDIYTYDKLLSYIDKNYQYLASVMSKNFISEYAQIRYFTAILKNSLNDFIEDKEEIQREIIIDIPKNNYKTKQRKKSLSEYEMEVGDDL